RLRALLLCRRNNLRALITPPNLRPARWNPIRAGRTSADGPCRCRCEAQDYDLIAPPRSPESSALWRALSVHQRFQKFPVGGYPAPVSWRSVAVAGNRRPRAECPPTPLVGALSPALQDSL